jgi:hypothetical protein
MSTTIDVTNTAAFESPKSPIHNYCQTHQYLMRDGITCGRTSAKARSDGQRLEPSTRALRSELLRDNAETQRTALLTRRRTR